MGVLDGRVALVTGAGQGSGRGVALAFAREGAAVAVVGRTEATLAAVAEEVERAGAAALVVVCDVGRPEELDDAVRATVGTLGRLDVLVNAAHHPVRRGRLLDMADEDIEALWATGPRATLQLMRLAHPHLRGGGSVINFGSGTELAPQRYGVYAATKEAIRAISRAAAVEWGPDGIRVNVLAPLAASPAMDEAVDTARRQEALLRSVPLGRIGDPERDVGRVAVFLAGPDAAFVTGQLVLVDGGQLYHR